MEGGRRAGGGGPYRCWNIDLCLAKFVTGIRQPFAQDSEATEHGLELADAPGMQEPHGGFADLSDEEKKRRLTSNYASRKR